MHIAHLISFGMIDSILLRSIADMSCESLGVTGSCPSELRDSAGCTLSSAMDCDLDAQLVEQYQPMQCMAWHM